MVSSIHTQWYNKFIQITLVLNVYYSSENSKLLYIYKICMVYTSMFLNKRMEKTACVNAELRKKKQLI